MPAHSLNEFYRHARRTGKGASAALTIAREKRLAEKDAIARLEDMAVARDHAAPEDKPAAQERYEAARRMVTKNAPPFYSPACISWQSEEGGRRFAYMERPESFGLRHVNDVMPEAGGRDGYWQSGKRRGWFTDPFGDVFKDGSGLCFGTVYQLPGRKGHARFVAGYEFGGTDSGPTLDMSRIFEEKTTFWQKSSYSDAGGYWSYADSAIDLDAATEAARHADQLAQHHAEKEREYQTAWQLGRIYEEAGEEIANARKEALQLLKERRAARANAANFPTICEKITSAVKGYLRDIEKARAIRAKAIKGNGPHDLCVYMGKDEQAAFCDAAGLDTFPA